MNLTFARPPFNVVTMHDWYWLATDGRVFSSSSRKIVDENDAGYKAWKDIFKYPTLWPRDETGKQTTASMQDVCSFYKLGNIAT